MKDLLKTHTTIIDSNNEEIKSYGGTVKAKTPKLVVPVEVARRRVVTENLGEITRRKTEDKNMVELLAGGKVIGTAVAVYKTKTQRTWTVTIGDTVLEKQHTISKALRAFDEIGSVAAEVLAGPVKAKTKAKTRAKANG